MNYQEVFDVSNNKRDEFWGAIGRSDNDVIAPMLNPALMAGPRWPSLRQAYRVVYLDNGTILASDGLSDPYDDMDESPETDKYQGLGLEFYIKTYDRLTPADTGSWQLQLLMNVSQFAAQQGNLINAFDNGGTFSISLANPGLPDRFVHPEGYVGAFLGMTDNEVPAGIELPLEKIRIVNIKLLTAAELIYCMEKGKEGRKNLQALLEKQPEGAYSTLERQSVV